MKRERIAVIGAGIAGLGAAWTLRHRHDVHVFERASYAGGHTHTVTVDGPGAPVAVDTGFIVYNETTYPRLATLFDALGIGTRPTDMSFSVTCERCDVVYSGLGVGGVLADPKGALRPRFARFLLDVHAFHRWGRNGADPNADETLGTFLERGGVGPDVGPHYLLPLASALWSTGIPEVRAFPLRTLLSFFREHRLLQIRNRLEWRTVRGGSHRYVDGMLEELDGRVHTGTRVLGLSRESGGIRVRFARGSETFDRAIVATHADQALALLDDPTGAEREALGVWRYAESDAWLHSDERFLPPAKRAHASWNVHLEDCARPSPVPTVTYNLDRLQGHDDDRPYMVTLNPDRMPWYVHHRRSYRHPIFEPSSVAAREPVRALGDATRTYFCGAYMGNGFHEDGLAAGVAVGERLGGSFP